MTLPANSRTCRSASSPRPSSSTTARSPGSWRPELACPATLGAGPTGCPPHATTRIKAGKNRRRRTRRADLGTVVRSLDVIFLSLPSLGGIAARTAIPFISVLKADPARKPPGGNLYCLSLTLLTSLPPWNSIIPRVARNKWSAGTFAVCRLDRTTGAGDDRQWLVGSIRPAIGRNGPPAAQYGGSTPRGRCGRAGGSGHRGDRVRVGHVRALTVACRPVRDGLPAGKQGHGSCARTMRRETAADDEARRPASPRPGPAQAGPARE